MLAPMGFDGGYDLMMTFLGAATNGAPVPHW
jgi:hypothetical protein